MNKFGLNKKRKKSRENINAMCISDVKTGQNRVFESWEIPSISVHSFRYCKYLIENHHSNTGKDNHMFL